MTKEELVEKKKKLIKQYFDDCQAISEKYKEWRLKILMLWIGQKLVKKKG